VRYLLNPPLDNLSAIMKPHPLNWAQIGGQYSRGPTNGWDRTELCVGVISEHPCMTKKDLPSKWQLELVRTCTLEEGRQTTHSEAQTLTRKGEWMYSRRYPSCETWKRGWFLGISGSRESSYVTTVGQSIQISRSDCSIEA
jgi:hypothetical protein